jgi:hypothetical protein
MAEIADLTMTCGDAITPGIGRKLYAACACDIDVFPPFRTTTAPGDSITLNGDITLETGKKFAEVGLIVDSGEITHPGVGNTGSRAYNNQLVGKIQKTVASDEWFNKNRNACFVFIVPEKDGTIRVLGNKDIPAMITASEGKGGNTNDSEKVWDFTIMDTIGDVAPVYTGAIDLTA